jgi:integrase/recombinase XerD
METVVYTKHSPDCPHKSNRFYRRCRCRKWIYIAVERRRVPAGTRSWEQAQAKARLMSEGKPTDTLDRTTVVHAIDEFLQDKKVQNLADSTLSKLDTIFRKQFGRWCRSNALVYLDELKLAHLEKFRASWKDAPLARRKKQERLSGFFHYCVRHKWIDDNPIEALSKVRVSQSPTLYFTKEEFATLVDTVPLMYMDPRGANGNPDGLRQRLLAMVVLLRWSGLRIGDAVTLERTRLTADGKLMLYMAKTGEHVFVPLPAETAQLLRDLPNSNPKYFFWTGNGLVKSLVADWQRTFRKMFSLAELGKRCHPHMFRDTFAVEYLLAGMPLEQVSILLGHKSIKVTEKHYAPWVRARQEQLEESVKKAWTKN